MEHKTAHIIIIQQINILTYERTTKKPPEKIYVRNMSLYTAFLLTKFKKGLAM